MIDSIQTSHIQGIPLDRLKRSDDNVRKMPHNKAQIETLANSIHAHGQIQNLLVKTETDETGSATGFYLVTAGEGRRLAQLVRVKRKQIKADELIPCVIDDTRNAVAVSLAENEIRQPTMHPADQFVAFKNLVDAGQSMEDIAAQFSVTALIVQRRLKLANVAPEFIESYRKGTVALDVLMALALTDDHSKQRDVWASLRKHERHATVIRQRLTHQEIAIDEPMVRFVGLKAYSKAGGQIRRDLFAEEESEGYVMDAELLRKLASEKLQQEAAKVQAEGHAWVEIVPNLDYSAMAEYRHVQRVNRNPTDEEAAALAKLESERATLETDIEDAQDDDERLSDLHARMEAIEADIDALQERLAIPKPEEQAVSGVLISIGHDGKLRVERDLIKPEDRARFDRAAKATQKAIKSEGPPLHSAALTRRLSAHRTLGVQVALCEQPAIAFAALTHRLALQVFYGHTHGSGSAVRVGPEVVDLNGYGADVKNSPARAALLAHLEQCRQRLPDDADGLLPWLLAHSEAEGLKLLACCVAVTVDGVQGADTSRDLDALTRATALDMRKWWSATAESYFGSVPKARILEVVREAVSPEVASALSDLKKGELVASAEQRLAGRGWLPPSLR
jgi:ParB family transcriptional regulator, chromosome partitioning protein